MMKTLIHPTGFSGEGGVSSDHDRDRDQEAEIIEIIEIIDQLNWQSSLKYYLTENVNGQVSHNLPPYFRLLLVVLGTVSGQDYSGE